MATARYANSQHSSLGATSGKAAGGNPSPGYTANTEDFVASTVNKTITVS